MPWWEIAESQAGMVSHPQLRTAGLSGSAIQRLVDSGELVPFCRSVYRAGAAPLTHHARLHGATLATGGLISFATAGQLWGLRDDGGAVHVTIPHSRRVARPPGAVLHRVPVPPGERTARSGVAITSRTWTTLDLVASLPPWHVGQFADRAVQRGWLTAADIDRRLRRQPGRTGNRQLRLVAATLADGAAAHSERVLHRLIRSAGISGWAPNHPIWVDGELVAVVDVALPRRRVAIEVDGMAFHTDPERFQRDRHRQNDLVALGWTVVRFTWADLTERPGYVVAVLRRFGSAGPAERD